MHRIIISQLYEKINTFLKKIFANLSKNTLKTLIAVILYVSLDFSRKILSFLHKNQRPFSCSFLPFFPPISNPFFQNFYSKFFQRFSKFFLCVFPQRKTACPKRQAVVFFIYLTNYLRGFLMFACGNDNQARAIHLTVFQHVHGMPIQS